MHTHARRLLAILVLLVSAATAPPVHAQAVYEFDLPAQPLADALRAIARQTGTNVLFDSRDLLKFEAPVLRGPLTTEQAIARVLAGTNLQAQPSTDKTVLVKPATVTNAAAAMPIRLAQADTGALVPVASEPREEIIITGKQFNYEQVESVNKIPMTVKETPQSVKVITEDMMKWAGITEFEDAYKIDASSHASHLDDGYARNYFRGFLIDSDNAFKFDGMRAFGVIDLDLTAMERIEVVKGSTSTMYGHGPIGGMVNAVSKKPTAERGGSLSLEAGSYSHVRGVLDVHGGLTADDRLTGRLVASYLDQEGAVDFFQRENIVIAPSIKFAFTDQTSVSLLAQYQKQDFTPLGNFGVQVADIVGGMYPSTASSYSIPNPRRGTLAGQPDQFFESELTYGRLLLEHAFTGGWQLRANGQFAQLDNQYGQSQGVTTYAETGLTDLEFFGGDDGTDIQSFEVNTFGNFTLGGREHTLFFGADYYESDSKGASSYGWLGTNTGFSIYDPDYSVLPRTLRNVRDYTPDNPELADADYVELYGSDRGYTELGYTAQVFLRPTDKLRFMLAARYAEYETGNTGSCCDLDALDAPFDPKTYYRNYALTYQTGVTYSVNDRINVYASYGETFQPRNQFSYNPADPDGIGNPVGPEEGVAYEIGLKGDTADQRFSWSAALYDIARTNITQGDPDPTLESRGFVVAIGEQRARGLEIDAQGQIVKGWSVYFSGTVMENEFTEGEFNGYPAFFAPRWGVSLFSSYQVQGGNLQGLGFGGGAVYKKVVDPKPFFGSAQGVTLDLFDDVFEVDARVFYERGKWNYELAVTNLLDEKYYSPSYPSPFYAINVNPGRQVIGKVTYDF